MVQPHLHLPSLKKSLAYTCVLGFAGLITMRCATTVPPTGGPKDTLSPVLLTTTPRNNEKNFKQQELQLVFNEMVVLKNPKEEIIITPNPGKEIQYVTRKNTVLINIKPKLLDSQTYSIAFRQAIQDITEGNPVEDLNLAFSTGPVIDTLSIFGTITTLPDGRRAQKYTVGLYISDTFDIFKHSPSYFTRTDKQGRFIIRNLKPGRYRIYCFDDKNKNMKCDSQSERFGFQKALVRTDTLQDSVHLTAIRMDARKPKLNSYRNISNYGIIRLNKAPASYTIKYTETKERVQSFNIKGSSEILYYPTNPTDSLQVDFSMTDSLNQKLDSSFYIRQTKQKPIKETFKITFEEAAYTAPTGLLKTRLQASHPVINRLPDSISLYIDSIFHKKLRIDISRNDTINGSITTESRLALPDTLLKKPLKVVWPKGTYNNIFQDTAAILTKALQVRTKENLATLVILNKPSDKQLIQIVTDKGDLIAQQKVKDKNVFTNLDPSSVTVRRVSDLNNNEKWSPGNIYTGTEPEGIEYYTNSQGKRSIPLRSNWEVEIDWTKPVIVDKPKKPNTNRNR